ncbi:hypothetical protein, partial [uncultured Algoriphagus sp.]|uniref:hypothetical protein n=1 Tax=uncultured Algoriphagus sp. TaxID=417365 RepID=UPI0032B27CB7
ITLLMLGSWVRAPAGSQKIDSHVGREVYSDERSEIGKPQRDHSKLILLQGEKFIPMNGVISGSPSGITKN